MDHAQQTETGFSIFMKKMKKQSKKAFDESKKFAKEAQVVLKTEFNKSWEHNKAHFRRFVEWLQKHYKDILEALLRGLVVGIVVNAIKFIVVIGGRSSNIVQIFARTVLTRLGNPRWFARVDMPHKNVPFHHINVNKHFTGVKDPHIKISPGAAKAAGTIGKGLRFINKVAIVVALIGIAYEVYQLIKCIMEDYKNGSCRNTIKRIVDLMITLLSGYGGTFVGAAIGTLIFPGIGTMIGILVGGATGGIFGKIGSDLALDPILDFFKLDVYSADCENCGEKFECRRYEKGDQKKCEKCRNEKNE